ncbi:hypothetical protein [Chitinophaga arvensicola]|uniref:Lipid-binding hydrolase n=1 Tax=Chitinophaga arvensicola TaxID=29529 RepID=A0A1I0P1N9_9BACT|nr:hypothetical protein [Chitinophaga arvensicola]SEW08210.1 hypothetical protein SAMN04488122_0514 [Chitinophaga arvensicola]
MKHYTPHTVHALPVMALLCILFLFPACQQDVDGPSISCPGMQMLASIDNRSTPMNFSRSLLFRERTDTGGLKFLSLETVSDSFKIVLNVTDGMYEDAGLLNDSLKLKTYIFSRQQHLSGGLVAMALKNAAGQFDFLTTDSSSVTIRKINLRTQTVSGNFYFTDNAKKIVSSGTFDNACYLSLQ